MAAAPATCQALRDLLASVARLDPSASVKFAEVDGLGKIVLSNIRTPKVRVMLAIQPRQAGAVAMQEGHGCAMSNSLVLAPSSP